MKNRLEILDRNILESEKEISLKNRMLESNINKYIS